MRCPVTRGRSPQRPRPRPDPAIKLFLVLALEFHCIKVERHARQMRLVGFGTDDARGQFHAPGLGLLFCGGHLRAFQ